MNNYKKIEKKTMKYLVKKPKVNLKPMFMEKISGRIDGKSGKAEIGIQDLKNKMRNYQDKSYLKAQLLLNELGEVLAHDNQEVKTFSLQTVPENANIEVKARIEAANASRLAAYTARKNQILVDTGIIRNLILQLNTSLETHLNRAIVITERHIVAYTKGAGPEFDKEDVIKDLHRSIDEAPSKMAFQDQKERLIALADDTINVISEGGNEYETV